ncbi:hypothetical protein GCM10022403_000810 [Streptomyces coacervatus]|uniref:Uncharacterized protein n=1 Tax=Streptomyces coacervatus TaxID=647381 RepID=A0ABP7GKT5_9ACTN
MTVPGDSAVVIVRDALRGLPVEAVVDAASVRQMLPVIRVLGPAVLLYPSPERFRPAHPGALTMGQLPVGHRELTGL